MSIKMRLLKKVAKVPSEDEMTREVAKKGLTLAAEKNTKVEVFNQKRTVKKRRFAWKKAVMMKWKRVGSKMNI